MRLPDGVATLSISTEWLTRLLLDCYLHRMVHKRWFARLLYSNHAHSPRAIEQSMFFYLVGQSMIFSTRLSAPARSSWNDLGLGISTSLASIQFTSSAAIPANIDEELAQDVQARILAMIRIAYPQRYQPPSMRRRRGKFRP